MAEALQTVLAEYERRAAAEWPVMAALPPAELGARIDEFLIFIGPDTGRLLHAVARGARAKTIIELGASYGYSTLWLADVARETGGKVHSLELSAQKVEYARSQLRRVGLDGFVEFHVGDALATLRALPGPFDFVLVDLWKDLYVPCLEIFHAKLAPGAFVAADNMIYPPNPKDQEAYRQAIRARADLDTLLLPVGSGIELSKKAR